MNDRLGWDKQRRHYNEKMGEDLVADYIEGKEKSMMFERKTW